MNTTIISTKGQVTIPEIVRRKLGIKSGDKAIFQNLDEKSNQVTIKVIKKVNLKDLAGSLHVPGMKMGSQQDETWI